jgi:hypothetical protein
MPFKLSASSCGAMALHQQPDNSAYRDRLSVCVLLGARNRLILRM